MKILRLLAIVAATASAPLSLAHAQTPGGMQQNMDRAANFDRDRVANELAGNGIVRDRRGRVLNPGQILNAAKSAASASGLACQVTEAALLGVTPDNNDLWEVACQTGPGYLITSPKNMAPVDCTIMVEQAERMKADGVTPPPGSTCILKGNQKKPG